jgi:hypothetical protein
MPKENKHKSRIEKLVKQEKEAILLLAFFNKEPAKADLQHWSCNKVARALKMKPYVVRDVI